MCHRCDDVPRHQTLRFQRTYGRTPDARRQRPHAGQRLRFPAAGFQWLPKDGGDVLDDGICDAGGGCLLVLFVWRKLEGTFGVDTAYNGLWGVDVAMMDLGACNLGIGGWERGGGWESDSDVGFGRGECMIHVNVREG